MTTAVAAERVDNGSLRREFERRRALGWVTADIAAIRLGWIKADGYPDGTRVLRNLGLVIAGNGTHHQRTMPHERAVEMCRAIGCDPRDVSL